MKFEIQNKSYISDVTIRKFYFFLNLDFLNRKQVYKNVFRDENNYFRKYVDSNFLIVTSKIGFGLQIKNLLHRDFLLTLSISKLKKRLIPRTPLLGINRFFSFEMLSSRWKFLNRNFEIYGKKPILDVTVRKFESAQLRRQHFLGQFLLTNR